MLYTAISRLLFVLFLTMNELRTLIITKSDSLSSSMLKASFTSPDNDTIVSTPEAAIATSLSYVLTSMALSLTKIVVGSIVPFSNGNSMLVENVVSSNDISKSF